MLAILLVENLQIVDKLYVLKYLTNRFYISKGPKKKRSEEEEERNERKIKV
jgi:hypothetical protein